VSSADIAVLATPALREAYAELVPLFGRGVTITWVGTAELAQRVDGHDALDAVICVRGLVDELERAGKLVAGSRTDVARSAVGVAVKAGAVRPDFGSEQALKSTLLAARTIGISTGPSGVYLNQLFRRMGVLEEIRPKFRIPAPGGMVADFVAAGQVDIAFQQVAELVNKPGVAYVGALPDSLQGITVFSGAVAAGSREPQQARALLRFLASPEHAALLTKHGLQPVGRQ
jgi:molybdate transport system substrate-binding protein